MQPEEVAQVKALVKCGAIMWGVLGAAILAFTVVGVSELMLYQTGFSFALPGLFIFWLAFRLRKDYWEAAALWSLRRDAADRRLAVIVAVSPELNARLEVLPNSLYLWSVDGQPAPWRELRVRRDLARG